MTDEQARAAARQDTQEIGRLPDGEPTLLERAFQAGYAAGRDGTGPDLLRRAYVDWYLRPSNQNQPGVLHGGTCREHPGVAAYHDPACGFHWHGRDGADVPLNPEREPICPRCALALVSSQLGDLRVYERQQWDRANANAAEVTRLRTLLDRHHYGFQALFGCSHCTNADPTLPADVDPPEDRPLQLSCDRCNFPVWWPARLPIPVWGVRHAECFGPGSVGQAGGGPTGRPIAQPDSPDSPDSP